MFLDAVNKKFALNWSMFPKLIDVFKFKDNLKKDSKGLHIEGDFEGTKSFWHILYIITTCTKLILHK